MSEEIIIPIVDLVADLILAKVTEDRAKAKRIEVEEKIADQVETKETGSKTITVGSHKLTVKRGLNYKVDFKAMRKAAEGCHAYAPIKNAAREMLDVKAYEWQRENCKEVYDAMSLHVKVTPAKVGVTLKAIIE